MPFTGQRDRSYRCYFFKPALRPHLHVLPEPYSTNTVSEYLRNKTVVLNFQCHPKKANAGLRASGTSVASAFGGCSIRENTTPSRMLTEQQRPDGFPRWPSLTDIGNSVLLLLSSRVV